MPLGIYYPPEVLLKVYELSKLGGSDRLTHFEISILTGVPKSYVKDVIRASKYVDKRFGISLVEYRANKPYYEGWSSHREMILSDIM